MSHSTGSNDQRIFSSTAIISARKQHQYIKISDDRELGKECYHPGTVITGALPLWYKQFLRKDNPKDFFIYSSPLRHCGRREEFAKMMRESYGDITDKALEDFYKTCYTFQNYNKEMKEQFDAEIEESRTYHKSNKPKVDKTDKNLKNNIKWTISEVPDLLEAMKKSIKEGQQRAKDEGTKTTSKTTSKIRNRSVRDQVNEILKSREINGTKENRLVDVSYVKSDSGHSCGKFMKDDYFKTTAKTKKVYVNHPDGLPIISDNLVAYRHVVETYWPEKSFLIDGYRKIRVPCMEDIGIAIPSQSGDVSAAKQKALATSGNINNSIPGVSTPLPDQFPGVSTFVPTSVNI